MLVHPSRIARDADTSAQQQLRDQLGLRVYPAHRLDRKTSGVLLFAKNPKANSILQQQFQNRQTHKKYWAIVRGFIAHTGSIDYDLTHEGKTQTARTDFRCLDHYELPLSSGQFPTSRYSLVELIPQTGRFHQIRKHLSHISHPIIGDRPHGCNKQNRFWKTQFDMTSMLLHAKELTFTDLSGQAIGVSAPLSPEFQDVLNLLTPHQTKP